MTAPAALRSQPRGLLGLSRSLADLTVSPQQPRQLGEVRRHPSRFVPGEQLGRRGSTRLLLEIKIPEACPFVSRPHMAVFSPVM